MGGSRRGVVTNVGPVHLEGCGSVDGVAHAKGELFHALREAAVAVANADDARVLAAGEALAAQAASRSAPRMAATSA